MKKFALFLFVLFAVFSCQNPANKSKIQFETISVDKKVYARNDSANPAMSINLSLTYPTVYQNDTTLTKLQGLFVNAFGQEDYKGRSPKGAIEAAEKGYTEDALDLANALDGEYSLFGECYAEVKTSVLPDSVFENIITVATNLNNYMGGAHGSNTTTFYCIDIENIVILTEKDVFEEGYEPILSRLLSKALLKEFGDSVNDIVFDYESVAPNGNFYFSPEGITYTFNEYEIAPYSSGTITVQLPYSEVNAILNPGYKKQTDK